MTYEPKMRTGISFSAAACLRPVGVLRGMTHPAFHGRDAASGAREAMQELGADEAAIIDALPVAAEELKRRAVQVLELAGLPAAFGSVHGVAAGTGMEATRAELEAEREAGDPTVHRHITIFRPSEEQGAAVEWHGDFASEFQRLEDGETDSEGVPLLSAALAQVLDELGADDDAREVRRADELAAFDDRDRGGKSRWDAWWREEDFRTTEDEVFGHFTEFHRASPRMAMLVRAVWKSQAVREAVARASDAQRIEERRRNRVRNVDLQPRSPDYFLMTVHNPAVRTLTGLAGGSHRLSLAEGIQSVTLTFDAGDPTTPGQLEIPWSGDAAAQTFSAIRERYGDDAVRDLLAMMLFSWTARVRHDEAFWWFIDEHLEAVKAATSPAARRTLRDRLTRLASIRIEAKVSGGRSFKGQLVTTLDETRDAVKLYLSPLLIDGFMGRDGKRGSWFWPTPTAVLAMDTPRAIALAVSLASQLRRNGGGPVEVRWSTVLDWTGIPVRTDRNTDMRAYEQTAAALDALQRAGMIERWEGKPGSDDGKITIAAPERPNVADVRPAWLPSTAGELAEWIERHGLTQEQAAQVLGVSRSTLKRALASPEALSLPKSVRAGVRAYLWPAFT